MRSIKIFRVAAFVGAIVALQELGFSAQTINLRGQVSDKDGKAVAEAIVELAHQGLKDMTGTDGTSSIIQSVVAVLPSLALQTEKISLSKGVLELTLNNSSPLRLC